MIKSLSKTHINITKTTKTEANFFWKNAIKKRQNVFKTAKNINTLIMQTQNSDKHRTLQKSNKIQ